MTQLLLASTLYQCLSLAAADDAGLLPGEAGEERILVLANSSQVPEVTGRLQDTPGFDRVAARFDRVLDLGALIYPRRPPQFGPQHEELRMWQTLLRSHWELGDEPVRLVLDSVHVNPGIALSRIFSEAPLVVHSDGLMVYGPTRAALAPEIAQRLDGLLYLDLVPGLTPQLLREYQAPTTAIAAAALRTVVMEMADAPDAELDRVLNQVNSTAGGIQEPLAVSAGSHARPPSSALILGQYLTELKLISREEEAQLHFDMLLTAAERGVRTCIFKPHPSAGRASTQKLVAEANRLGMDIVVLDLPVPAEVVMAKAQPDLVIGAFSTAMATARYVFHIDAAAVGTSLLLERITPYENSNRIPITIVDALLVRALDAPAGGSHRDAPAPAALQQLVDAVAYCMQPVNLASLRGHAIWFLDSAAGCDVTRYFKRRRLTSLDLPGSLPAGRRALALASRVPPAVRTRVPRRMRGLSRRVLAAVAG